MPTYQAVKRETYAIWLQRKNHRSYSTNTGVSHLRSPKKSQITLIYAYQQAASFGPFSPRFQKGCSNRRRRPLAKAARSRGTPSRCGSRALRRWIGCARGCWLIRQFLMSWSLWYPAWFLARLFLHALVLGLPFDSLGWAPLSTTCHPTQAPTSLVS